MKQSKFNKKYKALILDLDGTTIPSREYGMPSEKVKKVIDKASKKIKISVATSRPLPMAIYIIEHLSLTAPCILAGGGNIYDPVKKVVVKEVLLDNLSLNKIKEIAKRLKFDNILIHDSNGTDYSLFEYKLSKPLHMWTGRLEPKQADLLFEAISKIPTVSVHKLSAWETGKWDVMATPLEATKQHGILQVAEILGIKTHDIIGVGDGYNDFPLLMACGLKIAMGNAVEELKAIADYIAPSVDDDGVADVIEKFVLRKETIKI